MSHTYILGQQNSPSAVSDAVDLKLRGTRDGAAFTAPWIQALVLEGRVFGSGNGATALGVAAGTFSDGALDTDEFDYLQTIPATVAVIPVYIRLCIVTVGTALETGFHAFWGGSGVAHATNVAVTPHNLRPGSSNVSACTVVTIADTGGTAFVPAGLIARDVAMMLTPAANQATAFIPQWSCAQAGYAPVIEGGVSPTKQIAIFVTGQAETGYLHHVWVELPIARVT